MAVNETKMLATLKHARSALKCSRVDEGLAHIRTAIRMIEPSPPHEPLPNPLSRAEMLHPKHRSPQ